MQKKKHVKPVGAIALYDLDRLSDLVVPTEVEANTVACSLILACGVAIDAMTAFDPLASAELAPASLRVSSLVLVAILASPKLVGINLVDQRVLVAVCLAAVAFVGKHTSSESLRLGDSLYSVLMLLSTIQIFQSGGIEAGSTRPDTVEDKPHRRQTMSGLCAALLFYVGLRGVRAAFFLAQSASEYKERFQIGESFVEATGFAHCSLSVSLSLGFGHGVVIAVAALIGLHTETRVTGSTVVAFEVGFAGVVVCTSALWAFMAIVSGIEALPILYGESSCRGNSGSCPVAARARRFAMVNESSASLWVAGLAMLVFSFATEKRFIQMHPFQGEKVWQRTGFPVGIAVLGMSVLAVFRFEHLSGTGWHTDVIMLLSLFSIFTIIFSDTFVGELMYASAMTYEQVALIHEYGRHAVFQHITHLSLTILIVVLWAHIAVYALRFFVERWWFLEVKKESILNKSLGVLSTAGVSLSFALFLATTLLIASSNGTLPTETANNFRNGSVNRYLVAFSLDHFLPLFVFAPIYASQSEAAMLTTTVRRFAWVVVVGADVLLYGWCLVVLRSSAPTFAIMQFGPLAPAAFCGLLSWVATGFS
jgi:hypothetical protein